LFEGKIPETGKALLSEAADRGHPRAALALAHDLFRAGEHEAGRGHLRKLAEGEHTPYIRALACRALAIDAERRLKDRSLALSYAEAALPPDTSSTLPLSLREDLARRRDRLAEKRAVW
jgi:hypothetical protein